MEKNTQEKSLVETQNNSLFMRIKAFFKNIFSRKKKEEVRNVEQEKIEEQKNKFIEDMKCEQNNESLLQELEFKRIIDLQKRYRRGEIAEEDLSEDEVQKIARLYDQQIEIIKSLIEEKKREIKNKGKK